jgi:hypothetical protein
MRPHGQDRGPLKVTYTINVVSGPREHELEVRQAAAILGVLRWHLRQRRAASADEPRTT